MTEGKKFDDGKPRYDLLPADALHEVVRVFTYGAGKYAARNWENGIAYGRVFGAVMRHMWAFWRGEELDPETGISHVAHAVTEGLFLLAFVLRRRRDLDDRPVETMEVQCNSHTYLGHIAPHPLKGSWIISQSPGKLL